VTQRTVHRKTSGGVVRIRSRLELRQVTGAAVRRQTGEFPIDVALRALHAGVRAR